MAGAPPQRGVFSLSAGRKVASPPRVTFAQMVNWYRCENRGGKPATPLVFSLFLLSTAVVFVYVCVSGQIESFNDHHPFFSHTHTHTRLTFQYSSSSNVQQCKVHKPLFTTSIIYTWQSDECNWFNRLSFFSSFFSNLHTITSAI